MTSKFAAAIKAGLHKYGITQAEFSEKVEVEPNTVSRWVTDKHMPERPIFNRIVEFFGWSEEKADMLLEDWYENDHGERRFRVAGAEFVQSNFNGDYVKFLEKIIELDEETIIGIRKEHEGTPEQWAPIFQTSPYTWKVLISSGEIVGYWQFVCLKDEYFRMVAEGELVDSEITVDMLDYPVVDGNYNAYFCVLTMKSSFRGHDATKILNESLKKCIFNFTKNGILFKAFYATAFTPEGKRMCELLGMDLVKRHPRALDSEVAEIFKIEGRSVKKSYWGRDSFIQKTYREEFG